MSELLKSVPAEILIIIIILFATLFVFLFRYTLKKLEDAFDEVNNRLDLVCINQESTDSALNSCKLGNGKSYMEYRNEARTKLIQDYEIKKNK